MTLSKLSNITLNYTIYYSLKYTVSNLASKNLANTFISLRRNCSKCIMKFLNVAEKSESAKNIADYLSHGNSRKVNKHLRYA